MNLHRALRTKSLTRYTFCRRCKTTASRTGSSSGGAKGKKAGNNAAGKAANTKQPKEPSSQNLPAPFVLPDVITPSKETQSSQLNPFISWSGEGRPIPKIRPPPATWKEGTPPPQFIIDLDLPPGERWATIMEWGAPFLRSIILKFETPKGQSVWRNEFMQSIERRYTFSNEQYAEMQGIAAQGGIPFHKIIDYNLMLTSQFGCTSGTAPLMDANRLLHFRVLDPAIPLPQLLFQAHFIRRRELIASAIMHVGHVAITTGVRRGLSISINTKEDYVQSRGARAWGRRFEWALYDPWSIVTRDLLLRETLPSLRTAKSELAHGIPDGFFSVVSNGQDAASLDGPTVAEQAWRAARDGVLVQGNHYADSSHKFLANVSNPGAIERMEKNATRVRRMESLIHQSLLANKGTGVKIQDLHKWITSPPVKQIATTLACIMDPTEGNILWSAAYKGQ